MTVYVDDMRRPATVGRLHALWSHLTADDQDELHRFAARLGLRRAWFQDHPARWHYDVTEPKRRLALRRGAQPITYPHGIGRLASQRLTQTCDQPPATNQKEEPQMGEFTDLENARIVQAAEDHAADWYGGPFGFGADSAARYVTEGHLEPVLKVHGLSAVWDAVAEVLQQRPDLLTATQDDRETRKQARRERAAQLEKQAAAHFRAGRYRQALLTVDEMEHADPAYRPSQGRLDVAALRARIQAKARQAEEVNP